MLRSRAARRWLLAALTALGMTGQALAAGIGIHPVEGLPPAPALSLPDLDGETRTIEQYRGKVVAVNFWATWCPPCRKEMPSMQRTYDALRDRGLEILAVDIGEDWDAVSSFFEGLEEETITFPVLLDDEGTTMSTWEVIGLPTTIFLDRQGRITHRMNGGRDWDGPVVRKALEAMLAPR